MTKYETICIRRQGLDLLHTEGADFAAKITYLAHTPGQVYDPRTGIKQEMLIPQYGKWE